MLTRIRRNRSGQAIVIMALAMVGICGMLALAIDAGRLYFQRRLMQNAVDAGALAGAQDLVGTVSNPNGLPNQALFHAQQDAFSVFNLPAIGDPADNQYQQPSVTQTQGGYTVTTVAPTGYNNKQVQVTVSYNAVATFVQILGFKQVAIVATATAEAGTNAKTYAIFAYGGIGTGNTINAQLAGVGQIDNGLDGADACDLSTAGLSISNAKFHIPTSSGLLNINGRIVLNQGSDNQNLAQFWNTAPPFGTGQDPKPNYSPPNTSVITTTNPPQVTVTNIPANGGTATVPGAPGVILNNPTPVARDYVVFFPGRYTNPIVIPRVGDNLTNRYVFLNGVYWFNTPGSLSIAGGTISNTSTGLPHYVNGVGATDLPAAADGTDGVEFYMDGTSSLVAANTQLTASSVFFVAPNIVQPANGGGAAHVAVYIASTNTAPLSFTNQNFNATTSNAPIFQIWGTVFDSSQGGGSLYLRAVQLGPHKLNPTDSDPSGQYAVNGELIGYVMTVDVGNIFGSSAGSPPDCSGGTPNWTGHQGTPGLMVQFNKNFVPTPGTNSFLVK
ncbi:MAG TPA: TadE/TadG family type IV pilus assembly protein [Candidatus Angelobacter sp.]|nr:TadE/TadG family type IV pilus assembly protein [Candidatus Angelobacter sp.]